MGTTVESALFREQLQRLLQSRTFEGSESQRRLLTYLADKALAGESDRLKEYTVAVDALGKSSAYDPRHDSAVRIQVGRLRQKLGDYYRGEGAQDAVVVTLPKGGFQLNFAGVDSGVEKDAPGTAVKWRRMVWILSAVSAVLAIWATKMTVDFVTLRRATAPITEAWTPELESLWAPILQSGRPLLVCLGTPLFVRFPEFGFYRDPGVNEWQSIDSSQRYRTALKAFHGSDPMPWYSFTGAGEANGAFLLGKLLATRQRQILLRRSNLLSWLEMTDHNVVFVGPPKFNMQLDRIPIQQEVTIESNGIRNLHPRSGEPAFLADRFEPGVQFDGVTHALISLTPGLSKNGELLILGGNSSADTFAAAEWVTQPANARELVSHLRQPSGALPRYYQCVIRVQFRNGIPIESSYVFHRVLQAR